ncbi:MAG: SMP-30/gluconolactonase/LRE family protein [Kiritimatiellae bacterium]|jgi:sugar lactone lactonase YvrE|nr:SMP-30/gluconolactonase/LRE family protein [Kiritimatiellia bacterium]
MTPEPIGKRVSRWGEGPVWWRDHLYYVDIEGHTLVRLNPQDEAETTWVLDQRIGFALPSSDGRWIWGGDHGLYTLDIETGESDFIADPESHLPHNRFNDAAVSPDGRLFAGTIATDKETGAATLYRLDATPTAVVPNVTNSNGLAWSPDGSACYYIDTPTRIVLRFDYRAETGELAAPRAVIHTDPLIDASPDGMCADAEGKLWIAFCHGGCVIRVDPVTGKELDRVHVPCIETTSCCFGGPDLRDLYITTGIAAKKEEPHAGRIFVVKHLPVPGCPQPVVK